jgi:hypothetical protein
MDEGDVFAAAMVLIAQHGEKAASVAADNFVQLEKAGDTDRMAFWVAIMLAIGELTKNRPDIDEPK